MPPTAAAAADRPARAHRRTTGTGAWIYLGLLAAVVAAMVGVVAWEADPAPPPLVAGSEEPVGLVLRAEGVALVLEGRVPSAEVRDAVVGLAGARYEPASVTDALVVDDRTTLEGGSVTVTGTAGARDPDPGRLQADIVAAFDLRVGPVTVEDPDQVDGDGEADEDGEADGDG